METSQQLKSSNTSGLISGMGLIAGLMAILGASCCVFPLVLAILGFSSAWFANFSFLIVYRTYILGFALIIVGAGWLVAIMKSRNWKVFGILLIATLFVAGSFWIEANEPQINRHLVKIWRS